MQKARLIDTIRESFECIPDPRVARTRVHSLDEMLIMALVAVLCGADSFVGIEMFCRGREEWFREVLDLEHGIPSHDTFGRVFAALKPAALGEAFRRWSVRLATELGREVIAIDGKTLRRSFAKAGCGVFTHMVSAFATRNGIVLGQVKTAEKSNEIEAIPRLLDLLELDGAIVTIDAMGCQKAIAAKIIERDGDYLLAVKDNQPTLHTDVIECFSHTDAAPSEFDFHETHDHGHGRMEVRRCWVRHDLEGLTTASAWPHLTCVVRVESTRTTGGSSSCESRYFICSRSLTASEALAAVRSHWGIENQLHWILDVAFREDDARARLENAAENFSILRQLALNLLKLAPGPKCGMQNRRLFAGQNQDFLLAAFRAAC